MGKSLLQLLALIFFLVLAQMPLQAQTISKSDYQRAEQFLWNNVENLVYRSNVYPHWAENMPIFWYEVHTRKGQQYYVVDADHNEKKDFFDQKKFAQNLAEIIEKKIDPFELPIQDIHWNYTDHNIRFSSDGMELQADLNTLEIKEVKENPAQQVRLSSDSPDGKWTVYRKKYNLYLKNNSNNEEHQLTENGNLHYIYGASLPWAWKKEEGPTEKPARPFPLQVSWSPDSKKFTANGLDLRKAKRMYLLQNVPDKGFRAKVFSYYRALPGEDSVAKTEPYIFDVNSRNKTRIQVPPYDQVGNGGNWRWYGKDGKTVFFFERPRGYSSVALLKAETDTGKIDTVLNETSSTYVDPLNNDYQFLPESNELLWLSERDGWNHIYLYDLNSGNVRKQITRGPYTVKELKYIDDQNRKIYFIAGGREKDEDPYLNHLYVVDFNGSGLKLLTPENATHSISFSPGKEFFTDLYSRVDRKPESVLRRTSDGKVLMVLEEADIQNLLATGWEYPEPYHLKAADDTTDIYGVIFRPSDFNPGKSYPIIDGTYSGPQAVRTPKNFRAGYRNSDQPLAELGFIIITIDGRGTAERSKKFHDFSYKNLGAIGIDDHIKAIKEIAKKYPYIDLGRVGIYGHSAGGYDAARAILLRPDFYKVSVSSAGNHDLRVAKAWWPELYMGYPRGPQYEEQANANLAKNLRGKLLIACGDMDDNVHPSETMRLVNSLIKAGKDFDMFIMPNEDHGMSGNSYFIKLRWNYFVKNLLGAEPPANYVIGSRL